ncbi:MAG: GTPase [Planctomycetia bacterium]
MDSSPQTRFSAWADRVGELCGLIDSLRPLAGALGAEDPRECPWHGPLFDKLRPQVSREPVLVAAVCGGTNTGKSLLTNTLVGTEISRSVPEAARTRHPVASLPRGFAARGGVDGLFPGFAAVEWTGGDDAIELGPDARGNPDRLVWREDATGLQPPRLVLLDTPDIDGTLRENWHRAELVRNAADVIVAVLTQQKYNDAAVRDFFGAAAEADKAVIVVFNMVDWPRQRDRIGGWLATFAAETGVEPLAVYAAPHDGSAADAGRLHVHPLPELTPDGAATDLVVRLADCDFERIKLKAMEGALGVVLDPNSGVGVWLDSFERAAESWRVARDMLAEQARVRVDLPTAPREIVWNEIWRWLEPRRSGFDLAVSKVYRVAGRGGGWAARRVGLVRTEAERREDFSAVELAALKRALGDFVERLDEACRLNPRLASLLGARLTGGDRAAWYADLARRHAALPLVSEDYRGFVRRELDRFAAANPGMVQFILAVHHRVSRPAAAPPEGSRACRGWASCAGSRPHSPSTSRALTTSGFAAAAASRSISARRSPSTTSWSVSASTRPRSADHPAKRVSMSGLSPAAVRPSAPSPASVAAVPTTTSPTWCTSTESPPAEAAAAGTAAAPAMPSATVIAGRAIAPTFRPPRMNCTMPGFAAANRSSSRRTNPR